MSNRPFLITGLPRSRTAWFSVVASTGLSICHHEPCYGDFQSACALWDAKGKYPFVGIADAGLGMHLPLILRDVGPRTLIVERPLAAVLASVKTYFGSTFDYDPQGDKRLVEGLHALHQALGVEHPLIKRVAYADLQDIEAVRDCLSWLMPGVRPLNLEQMMHMNIQSDLGYNLAKLRRFRDERAA